MISKDEKKKNCWRVVERCDLPAAQSCLEDTTAWLCNDCPSRDPDEPPIYNITVCTTGWFNEVDADAQSSY